MRTISADLAQFRVSEITGTNDAPRPGGTLGDANYYGQSLLILLPIALYQLVEGRSRMARLAGGLGSLSLVSAIIFTYSRGDAVAMGTVLVAAVLYKRPNPLYFLGGLVALLIAIPFLPSNYVSRLTTIADVASSNRQAILSEDLVRGRAGATYAAVEMFLDHPLLGVGRENYPTYQLEYLARDQLRQISPRHPSPQPLPGSGGGARVIGHRRGRRPPLHDVACAIRGSSTLQERGRRYPCRVSCLALYRPPRLPGKQPLPAWRAHLDARLADCPHRRAEAAIACRLSRLSFSKPPCVSARTADFRPTRVCLPIYTPAHRETSEAQIRGTHLTISFPGRRSRPVDSAVTDSSANVEGDEARRKLWLDAAERARQRGDSMTARALVDAVLARDPDNEIAWQIDLRLRFSAPVSPSLPVATLTTTGTAQPPSPPESPASQIATEPQTSAQPRTAYKVAQPFRDEWRRLGGAQVLGVPISPAFIEPTPEGRAIIVQYFTHTRMERYPEYKGTPNEVTLARLGTEVPIEGVVASPLPEILGGQQVSLAPGSISTPWKFSIFWHLKGGELVLGRPITPVLLWTAPDGSSRAVQYFERARLEHHADRVGTVDEVQLGELGSEVFERRYGGKRYVN